MSETKFTPGPWLARQEFANRWRIEVPREGFVPLSVGLACTTVLEVGVNDKDTAANAHLIAAAPELYVVLEQLLEDIDGSEEDRVPVSKGLRSKALAALKKARGEE